LTQVLLLALAFVLLVAGAEYFTNAVEWLGRRLGLSESATGSLLAAVGTALPETLVPIVAIFLSTGESSHAVGTGGILGAPFMLSTLAMLVIAVALWAFRGRRDTASLHPDAETAVHDLQFFLVAYSLAFVAGFLPDQLDPVRWLIAFGLIPLYFIYIRSLLKTTPEHSDEELAPLRIFAELMHLPIRKLPLEDWAARPGLVPFSCRWGSRSGSSSPEQISSSGRSRPYR